MGWRSSSPSSSWARCAAASWEFLDLILTTRSPRTGWSSRGLTVARYRPLRMCRWSMMWSCSTRRDPPRPAVWRGVCRWRDSRVRASAGRSRWSEAAIRGVLHCEESGRRSAQARGRGCGASGESAAWAPCSGRTRAGRQLAHERSDDADADDAGDHPGGSAAQPATAARPAARGVGAPSELAAGPQLPLRAAACCSVSSARMISSAVGALPAGSPRASLPPRSWRVSSSESGVPSMVRLSARLSASAERSSSGSPVLKAGRGPSALALIAAPASVLERPRAVGTLDAWSVPYSAVVSHHGHPNRNSTTII